MEWYIDYLLTTGDLVHPSEGTDGANALDHQNGPGLFVSGNDANIVASTLPQG
jgi:hypothetical protein